ncbi:hypothetical protein [Leminorella grimontii]|uniref:hypothetical protein n=1 Tax=Leminorella grimontii TaxID=82981 RepID=UPI00321FAAE3
MDSIQLSADANENWTCCRGHGYYLKSELNFYYFQRSDSSGAGNFTRYHNGDAVYSKDGAGKIFVTPYLSDDSIEFMTNDEPRYGAGHS